MLASLAFFGLLVGAPAPEAGQHGFESPCRPPPTRSRWPRAAAQQTAQDIPSTLSSDRIQTTMPTLPVFERRYLRPASFELPTC